jgi:pyruvate kinase
MRRRRSAKSLRPSALRSSTPEQIGALFEAGVDVFRLNFSHGTHEDHRARFAAIRAIESTTGRPIGILADLQGPKLRLGTFSEGRIGLAAGAPFRLDLDRQPGDETRAPLPHPEIFEAIQTGTELLLDDGKVRLRVETCGTGFADTLCLVGGSLSDRKGVNVPNAVLPLSAVTEKDRADLAFAIEQGADWVAFSFVQRPDDVLRSASWWPVAPALWSSWKNHPRSSVSGNYRARRRVDGGARDLGVEMPPEDVPSVRSSVIHARRPPESRRRRCWNR